MILTNIEKYKNLQSVFSSAGIEFHYINDNLFNMSTYNPEIIITEENANKAAEEFPNIKFVFPDGKFPNYKLVQSDAFNLLDYLNRNILPPKINIKSQDSCLVLNSKEDISFYQNYKDAYTIDTYNVKTDYSYVKNTNNNFDVYGHYNLIFCSSLEQAYQSAFLDKWIITNFDHPYSLIRSDPYIKKAAKVDAKNRTYYDMFDIMLREVNHEIANKLQKTKQQLMKELK